MANANLTLHCGAREVTREQLALVPCPAADGRWRPVPHHEVLDHAVKALDDAGYGVEKLQLGLTRDDQRFFGTLTLQSALVSGVSLAVGLRSSHDKSLSLGFAYGSRVFCCDNLAFRADKVIARKHTTNGVLRYQEAICRAVSELSEFRRQESARIQSLSYRDLTDTQAESLLLRCYEAQVLSARTLPDAIREWRVPSFEDFQPRTAWSLYNAVTFAISDRVLSNPQAHAALTIKLGGILSPATPQLYTLA